VIRRLCSKICSIFGKFFDRGEAALDEIAQGNESLANPVFGDLEDRLFGAVENEIGVLFGLIGVGEDAIRRVDQVPEGRLLLDDARVVLDVGRAWNAVGE